MKLKYHVYASAVKRFGKKNLSLKALLATPEVSVVTDRVPITTAGLRGQSPMPIHRNNRCSLREVERGSDLC
jgi:hypothetical protein